MKNEAIEAKESIVDKNNNIIVSKFKKLPSLIKEVIISEMIIDFQLVDYLPLSDVLFTDMLNIIDDDKDNVIINLPNNYIFGKEYDRIIFKKNVQNNKEDELILENNYYGKLFNIEIDHKYNSSNKTLDI